MKFDENLAAVHAYLCADGYVIKNSPTQKLKYYRIGFRNRDFTLLKDFQKRFKNSFGVSPHLDKGERCRLGSREIYEKLTKEFGSFYSWEWRMPKLNRKLMKIWLRAYFDCEGWVFCKSHQNRHIGVDCVNEFGFNQVENTLNQIGIKTIRKFNKKRRIHRIFIYGKENLNKFSEQIGFLNPKKSEKLTESLNDFVVYEWNFPEERKKVEKFVFNILKNKIRIKKPHYARLISKEEKNLNKLSKLMKEFYNLNCYVNRRINGTGTIYYELSINKKDEIKKLINLGLMPNLFKDKKTD